MAFGSLDHQVILSIEIIRLLLSVSDLEKHHFLNGSMSPVKEIAFAWVGVGRGSE